MKLGTWLGLAALVCAAGCSSSGKKTANQGDSKAVAEALSSGIMVEHGMKLSGVIPKPTADDVAVTENDGPVTLAPGDDEVIMSLDAENPDEADDPVEAMLMQFEDSDEHFEADVEAIGDGGVADGGTGSKHYEVTFSVEDGICKNFCKGEFNGVMVQALKLHKGGVSKHLKRNFKLDCRREGKEACESDKDTGKKDAGSGSNPDNGSTDAGGTSGGGSSDTLDKINTYSGALKSFSREACKCAGEPTGTIYCDSGLSQNAVECAVGKLTDNADMANVKTWATCAGGTLNAATATCKNGCSTCDPSLAATAGDKCTSSKLPDAVQSAIDECMLGGAPAEAAP